MWWRHPKGDGRASTPSPRRLDDDEEMAEAPPVEPAVQRKRRVIADEDEDEDM